MKKTKIITVILSAAVVAAIAFAAANSGLGINKEASASGTPAFDSKFTGSTSFGDALVELTPRINSDMLEVRFSINTHSVMLSGIDLMDITTLEYKGKVIKPVKASRIGGHHSSGIILFDTGKDIRNFTIKIKGIPNVDERVYEWNAG